MSIKMKIHRTNNIAMTPERQTNQKKMVQGKNGDSSIRDWAIKIESCAPKEPRHLSLFDLLRSTLLRQIV